MKLLRRSAVAALGLTLLVSAAQRVAAQALQMLPADPLVVLKINNPESISKKVADFSKRLGVDKFNPELAGDPLAALKQEMGLKEGLDATGEVLFALYENPKKAANAEEAENDDPRLVALIPISNYESFLKNFQNVKSEGNLSTFTLPDDDDTMYAANWGKYAAFTDKRGMDLIKEKGKGVTVAGLSAKQLQGNDAVLWANATLLSARVLPEFKKERVNWVEEMKKQIAANPEFPQKYTPVLQAAVNQALNIAEQTLMDAQSATIGVSLTPEKGLNTTVVAEFQPSSYLGKSMAAAKPGQGDLLTGLPNRKYFAYGGMVFDPEVSPKLFNDIVAPIQKELAAVQGNEAQTVNNLIESMKTTFKATQSAAFGYAMPTAPPGQQAIMQQVFVYNGDANTIMAATTKSWEGVQSLMKLLPQTPGMKMNMAYNKGTKTVDGVALDEMVMEMKVDADAGPEAAQAQQMMQMMYGPKGMGGYLGAVTDKKLIVVTGGNDQLLSDVIKAAKADDKALGQQAQIKAVSDALPQNRQLVYFVDIGNIATTALQFAAQMGMAMPMKLPEDMPPLGISAGTEGSAIRIDMHLSTELISNLVSAGAQAAMMMQGGQQQPGQL